MEGGLRFYISSKLPDEAYLAGTGNLGDRRETIIRQMPERFFLLPKLTTELKEWFRSLNNYELQRVHTHNLNPYSVKQVFKNIIIMEFLSGFPLISNQLFQKLVTSLEPQFPLVITLSDRIKNKTKNIYIKLETIQQSTSNYQTRTELNLVGTYIPPAIGVYSALIHQYTITKGAANCTKVSQELRKIQRCECWSLLNGDKHNDALPFLADMQVHKR